MLVEASHVACQFNNLVVSGGSPIVKMVIKYRWYPWMCENVGITLQQNNGILSQNQHLKEGFFNSVETMSILSKQKHKNMIGMA